MWPAHLAAHPKVEKVFYPGLKSHPQFELAKKQMTGFGAMITFETGSLKYAKRMLAKVRVCSLGESLGGVETLISHPATMTHAAQMLDHLTVADGLQRGFVLLKPMLQEFACFFEQTTGEHFVHASVDAGVEIGGGTLQAEDQRDN